MGRVALIATIIVGIGLSACTGYNPEGLGGGYSDTPLRANLYRVDVRGNGVTSASRVKTIALVRAADITLEAGYQRFVIAGASSDQTKSLVTVVPGEYQSHTSGVGTFDDNGFWLSSSTTGTYTPSRPIVVSKHRVSFDVLMLHPGDPGFDNGLDAKAILDRYGPEVGR